MTDDNIIFLGSETDATETDANTEVLVDINNNVIQIKYCILLFLLLWCVLSCKKIIHNAVRAYMDITKK